MKIIMELSQDEADHIYKILKTKIMESDLDYKLFKKFRAYCK